MELHPEYIGQTLLKLGFETFFRYMFKVIEGRDFIVEPIHPDLFKTFEEVYKLERLRQTINLPPRSSKTTLCEYFLVYAWTINPRCNFIYTSYSQSLLADIARKVQSIMENPIYKAMFPVKVNFQEEKTGFVDEFWREYLLDTEKQTENIYSAKKITTHAGGTCIFSSIGSQILGFGSGIRGAKSFSGMIIIDDANKPSDTLSEVLRKKTQDYFTGTLLSRVNDSNVPILNVQQRLHVDDLSGFLKLNYNFDVLVKPLIDHHGVCQIPSQYDAKRLLEIQKDKSVFSAQYQQEPILEEGNIIKREWWQYYDPEARNPDGTLVEPVKGVLIITADTAYKATKTSDFSCLQCWELRRGKLLMRDMMVDRWEYPELLENAKSFWDKWTNPNMLIKTKYFFIEDKASGISLVQTLQSLGIEAIGWKPKDFDYPEDKVSRAKEMSWDIFNGLVFLPKHNKMTEYLVNEAAAFRADMSHLHDDAVDCADVAHSVWVYYGGRETTTETGVTYR